MATREKQPFDHQAATENADSAAFLSKLQREELKSTLQRAWEHASIRADEWNREREKKKADYEERKEALTWVHLGYLPTSPRRNQSQDESCCMDAAARFMRRSGGVSAEKEKA